MLKVAIAVIGMMALGAEASAQVRVDGYTRKDGTYVQPHVRTTPDNNRMNNYGSQGNTNPYTGRQGTVDPYRPPSPSYGSGSSNSLYGSQRR